MRKLHWIWVLAIASLLIAAPPAAQAEEEEGSVHSKYMIVHIDDIEPSMQQEYEKINEKWVEAFKGAEMGPEFSWYSSNSGFTYVWVSPMKDYAFLDGEDARFKAMGEALGEEKMAELMEGSNSIKSHHTNIVKFMSELTYEPANPASKTPGIYRLTSHMVKPDMTEQFETLVKEVVAAFKKVDSPVGFSAYQTQYGTGSYVVTTMADDADQLNGFPGTGEVLTKALGEERAEQMFQEWRNCITDYETEEFEIRRDLSFVPMEAAD
ncbi:MAG: hypothetical protein WBH85_16690 [Thermoanaerobaculia bacterium]